MQGRENNIACGSNIASKWKESLIREFHHPGYPETTINLANVRIHLCHFLLFSNKNFCKHYYSVVIATVHNGGGEFKKEIRKHPDPHSKARLFYNKI